MSTANDMQIVVFDSLELAWRIGTRQAEQERRRFMTLMVPAGEGGSLRGGVGYVVKARNVMGETFALKRLNIQTAASTQTVPANQTQASIIASFRQEFEAHRLVTNTGAVPRLIGYAENAQGPAILMEWVPGTTLRELMREGGEGARGFSLDAVAGIGIAVLQALDAVHAVDVNLAHRDISPANIMIRTDARTLEEQLAASSFDVCLIDFGSASFGEDDDTSFTTMEGVLRGATPDYAAPEMLGRDDAGLVALRRSPSVDVYALCSVLYQLYSGMAPFDLKREETTAYRIKADGTPRRLEVRSGDDGSLAGAILSGITADQAARPSCSELEAELLHWRRERGARDDCSDGSTGANAPVGSAGTGVSSGNAGDETNALGQDGGRRQLFTPSATPAVQTAGTRLEAPRTATAQPVFDTDDANPAREKSLSRRAFLVGAGIAVVGVAVAAIIRNRMGSQRADAEFKGDVLHRVKQDGKWGYLNSKGEWVIRPMYTGAAGDFQYVDNSEAGPYLAFVQRQDDALFGFISPYSTPDNPVIDYHYADCTAFFNGYAAVQSARAEDGGLWGYIAYSGDNDGGTAEQTHPFMFAAALPFSEAGSDDAFACAPVQDPDTELWNYITSDDEADTLLFPEVWFSNAGIMTEGLYPVEFEPGSGYVFVRNSALASGASPADPKTWLAKRTFKDVMSFSEGYAAVQDAESGLWGFIDTDGKTAIEPRFASAQQFVKPTARTPVAAVQDAESGLWGFVDTKGSPLHADGFRFAELSTFERDLAAAREPDGAWGFVDASGDWAIEPEFEDAGVMASAGTPWEPPVDA